VATGSGVKAFGWKDQAMHGFPAQDVRGYDLIEVILGNMAIPHRIGIDDHRWPVLALVEASGLVCTNGAADAVFGEPFLQFLLELAMTGRITASSRMVFVALVGANKNVLGKIRHHFRLQQHND
jgi:hypothetical protein